jgi:tetratricopeptide (TPR) repeat protein
VRRQSRALAPIACAALALLAPPARAAAPPLVTVDSTNAVTWRLDAAPFELAPLAVGVVRRVARAAGDSAVGTSDAALGFMTTHALLRPTALRVLAMRALAAGDTADADTAWRRLAGEGPPWAWEALRARSDLALARGDTLEADSILARPFLRGSRGSTGVFVDAEEIASGAPGRPRAAALPDWTLEDLAARLTRRARLRAALRDTVGALDLAAIVFARYGSTPAALAIAPEREAWAASRGDSLGGEALLAMAMGLRVQDRVRAVTYFERALRVPTVRRRADAVQGLGESLRLLRRFDDAQRVLGTTAIPASDSLGRAMVALELARVHRDAGEPPAAFRAFERAARLAGRGDLARTAWWELGREAEELGDWTRATAAYGRVKALGDDDARSGTFRLGLHAYAAGESRRALELWRTGKDEWATFWTAAALRRLARAAAASPARASTYRAEADSLFRVLADRPSYLFFYRAAARESLGLLAPKTPQARLDAPLPRDLEACAMLIALGMRGEALELLGRWSQRDPQILGSTTAPRSWQDHLHGARLAFLLERHALGILLAQRAYYRAPDDARRLRHAIAPWLYPPAFDSLFHAVATDTPPDAVDAATLRSIAWQESRFDPQARSRSNAIGLVQLLPPAAGESARELGLAAPNEAALTDPGLNLRLGARYFARQFRRFEGRIPVALAAYNAGARPASRWAGLDRRGEDALYCELIAYRETQSYVKYILATRAAYRGYRPRVEGR